MSSLGLSRLINDLAESRHGIKKGDYFTEAPDLELRTITGGFPAVIRSTHPIFVVSSSGRTHRVSPCTRHPQSDKKDRFRYLNPGCLKANRFLKIPSDKTYILEDYTSPMPDDAAFWTALVYQGNVPEHEVHGVYRQY